MDQVALNQMDRAFKEITDVREEFSRRAHGLVSTERGKTLRRICNCEAAAIRHGGNEVTQHFTFQV
jgi:hypothetical protein